MSSLIEAIETQISLGNKVSFKQELNMFKVKLKNKRSKIKKQVMLPFDHLNEEKVSRYMTLMGNEILKERES